MEKVSPFRGITTSTQYAARDQFTQELILRSGKEEAETEAAYINLSSEKTTLDSELTEETKKSVNIKAPIEALIEVTNPDLKELHQKVESQLKIFGPDIARQYSHLVNSVVRDRERLSRFIEGVNQVINTIGNEEKEGNALLVGQSLSFSPAAHIEAAYAASTDKDVLVRRLALDLEISTEEENLKSANEDRLNPDQKSEKVKTSISSAVEAYKQNLETDKPISRDLLA